MMAELDYDALQRLADAATPGPWEAGDGWVYTMPVYPDDRRLSNVLGMKFADQDRADAERERRLRNAEFIAASRSAIPALLDRVRELEAADDIGSETIVRVAMERDAALSTIAKVRAAVSGHPKCDQYEDDGPITCGWKNAYASVVRALEDSSEVKS